jgi:hypothetical protein
MFSILLSVVFSFGCYNKNNCEIKEAKTLFTTIGIHDSNTSFAHYILINGFSKKCMDSATMVNLALKYIDTVGQGRPADVLMFFNSDKDFIPNETSQVMEDINKSCLVAVGFDLKERKPKQFLFYNDAGERIYWGSRWLPNGN